MTGTRYQVINTTNGPLQKIYVGDELSAQVIHSSGTAGQFAPAAAVPGDVGTWLVKNGVLYGSELAQHNNGSSGTAYLGTYSYFSHVAQSAVIDAGVSVGVYQIVTTVEVGNPLYPLRLTQVDTYVDGADSWRTDIHVDNKTGSAQSLILYRAGDANLNGHTSGYGTAISERRAPTAISGTAGTADALRMYPVSLDNAYYENAASALWGAIAAKTAFNNTAGSALGSHDNAIGVSWTLSVPSGTRVTRSVVTEIQVTVVTPPQPPAAVRFRGFVYLGVPYDTGQPLSGIVLRLYSNDSNELSTATLLASTVSDASGFWNFYREQSAAFMWVQAQDPVPWTATGCDSPDATAIDERTLQWSAPGETVHSGNRFWMIQA